MTTTSRSPVASLLIAASLVWVVLGGRTVSAQDNPVYVDDSPRAWELLKRAEDQQTDNVTEAARLYQELLDEYAFKLAPLSDNDPAHLTSVHRLVTRRLLENPALLERYRIIETAESRRLLDRGALHHLAITRSLTDAGLDALLSLAQDAAESARFRAAIDWLQDAIEHPAIDEQQAAHAWFMLALSAHYLGDDEQLATAWRTLEATGRDGASFRDQLATLLGGGDGPQPLAGVTPLDRTATTDLTDLVAEEIWSVPLNDSLLARRYAGPTGLGQSNHPGVENHRRTGALMTTAPTVAGSTVFVNQGFVVLALDRFTGRQRWSHAARHRMPAIDRDTDQSLDMSFVTVHGDHAVTLTGHAAAEGRATDGEVLCLDVATGESRWSRSLDRIGGIEDHEGLFPHGRPIIAEDRVYVLARKVTKQLLTSCYVIALDLESGTLNWARHIASSAGLRRSARGLSLMTMEDGHLYVATSVGAIARLRADIGEIHWLRRYNVPISPRIEEQNRRPWELPAPVVTEDSVVAIEPGSRRIVVLDRERGHEVQAMMADTLEGWNQPKYLVANDHSIYAIGREIRAFRMDMLERPIWQLPAPATSKAPGRTETPARLEIRGRVQVAANALIIPTLDGVLVVDDETGRLQHQLHVRSVGNPVATDSQLLLAGSDGLEAFMSFSRAEEMLRRRIATQPGDPEPALSLLRLGTRARKLELAIEAAGLALGAIELQTDDGASRRARGELFELLLEIDAAGLADSNAEGRELHAMIGSVAIEPEQRVAYLLAYGRWLASRSLAEAIERYQEILSDPALSIVARAEDGVIRPARQWAAQRIGALIESHGPDVYAPQADFADMRLGQYGRGAPGAAGPLEALAVEFPFAQAGLEATLQAAALHVGRGDARRAAAALLRVYGLVGSDAPAAPTLLGRYLELCRDQGWPECERGALEHIERTLGDIELNTSNGTRRTSAWRTDFDARTGQRSWPRIGTGLQPARSLPGRIVVPHEHARGRLSNDRVLLYDGQEVRMLRTANLAAEAPDPFAWRSTIGETAPTLLSVNEERMLLWLGGDVEDPRAIMLDAASGRELWSTPLLSKHLGNPVRDLIRERGVREQMPSGKPFDPKQVLPLPMDDRLVLVQRSGGIVAFDLNDTNEQLWSKQPHETLEQVHVAMAHPFGIVLAGLQRPADPIVAAGQFVPRVLILDPETGDVRAQIRPLGRGGVKWMQIGPLGTILLATTDGLQAVDLASGERRWSNIVYGVTDLHEGWGAGDEVVVEDRDSELRVVRILDGTVSAAFGLPGHGDWDPMDLQGVHVIDDALFARFRQRLVRYDSRGVVLGSDMIVDDRDYQWVEPVRDGVVLVSRHKTNQATIPDRAGRQTQHTYRVYLLTRDCRVKAHVELRPITRRLFGSRAMDGWLLLSTQSETLAIPMPTDR